MAWPPDFAMYADVQVASLPRRAAEVAVLFHAMFPKPAPPNVEFFDANTNVKRLLTKAPDGTWKNPWHPFPTTLTSQSRIVMRKVDKEGSCVVRPLSALELFSLNGWFPETFENLRATDLPDYHTMASLAGNAFSAYHLGPVLAAFFGSLGSETVVRRDDKGHADDATEGQVEEGQDEEGQTSDDSEDDGEETQAAT